MKLFTLGEEVNHRSGDRECPECYEGYPQLCRCGGLMHAGSADGEDADGNVLLIIACEACGRSGDMLDEV